MHSSSLRPLGPVFVAVLKYFLGILLLPFICQFYYSYYCCYFIIIIAGFISYNNCWKSRVFCLDMQKLESQRGICANCDICNRSIFIYWTTPSTGYSSSCMFVDFTNNSTFLLLYFFWMWSKPFTSDLWQILQLLSDPNPAVREAAILCIEVSMPYLVIYIIWSLNWLSTGYIVKLIPVTRKRISATSIIVLAK